VGGCLFEVAVKNGGCCEMGVVRGSDMDCIIL
jgi:hypothetical protein